MFFERNKLLIFSVSRLFFETIFDDIWWLLIFHIFSFWVIFGNLYLVRTTYFIYWKGCKTLCFPSFSYFSCCQQFVSYWIFKKHHLLVLFSHFALFCSMLVSSWFIVMHSFLYLLLIMKYNMQKLYNLYMCN